jgi:hypothetical protein
LLADAARNRRRDSADYAPDIVHVLTHRSRSSRSGCCRRARNIVLHIERATPAKLRIDFRVTFGRLAATNIDADQPGWRVDNQVSPEKSVVQRTDAGAQPLTRACLTALCGARKWS